MSDAADLAPSLETVLRGEAGLPQEHCLFLSRLLRIAAAFHRLLVVIDARVGLSDQQESALIGVEREITRLVSTVPAVQGVRFEYDPRVASTVRLVFESGLEGPQPSVLGGWAVDPCKQTWGSLKSRPALWSEWESFLR